MVILDNIQSFLSSRPEVINLLREDVSPYCAVFTFKFSADYAAPINYVYYDPHRNFMWNSNIVFRDAGREWESFLKDFRKYANALRAVITVQTKPVDTIYYPAGYTVGTFNKLKAVPVTIIKVCDNGSYFG